MAKVNKTTFKEALKNSGGNQSRIAEKLNVDRSTINKFLKKNPEMREFLEQEGELLIDIAEDNIAMAIMVHHNIEVSKWILLNSKRGRARGYGRNQEITLESNQANTNLTKEEIEEEVKRILEK